MIKPVIYVGQPTDELFGKREEAALFAEERVKEIIKNVKEKGDCALREYAAAFDGYSGESLKADEYEFEEAFKAVSPGYISVLKRAAENIGRFHNMQKRRGFSIEDGGTVVGQKILPIDCAGVYVPGGTAAYPSSVLMNVIPAKIAGVKKIVMATPVKSDGKIKPEVLAAAKLCGVDAVFKIGGAQAIAALAYGTETIPKVDKITGPGNAYVAAAKKLVSGIVCGIDMVAGPSEIMIIADSGANAVHLAADMLSQAEHDSLASALLITDSEPLAERVAAELENRVAGLPRREIAAASLAANCRIIVTPGIAEALEIANAYAPEHLELCVERPFELLDKVRNAGSVFLGRYTPEAAGDYYAGTNHTLPTGGSARFSSPLGVDDFTKTIQYVYYTETALKSAAQDIAAFAFSEGLTAHADSVLKRFEK